MRCAGETIKPSPARLTPSRSTCEAHRVRRCLTGVGELSLQEIKEIRDFVINNIQPRTIDNIRNYTGRLEGKSKIKEVESVQENVDESVVEVEKQLSLW